MSYRIAEYPQDKYHFRIYDNTRRLTWKQIQAEQGPDCVGVVNLAYFSLSNYSHQSAIMIGGNWGLKPKYHEYGFLIDESGRLTIGTEDQAVYDYAIGCPPVDINGRRYTDKDGGRNGWTYTGVKADGTVVVLLCSKDTPETTDDLEEVLRARGCASILRWDGSWSSQGTLGPGLNVTPSHRRICRSWLLIFKREGVETPPDKEEKPVSKKIVCLDPGHGPDTVNGSPDGSYKEREFCWDMYERISKRLENYGVHTICTRTEDTKPSLTERAGVSNRAGSACFVSLHSNAAGSGGWSDASGLEIYTSSGPMSAPRNVLATDLVNSFHAAGVSLRSEPIKHNIELTVLAKTDAPAVLIEYGFHTNRTDVEYLKDSKYRDKLADATASGICAWLCVQYAVENPVEDVDKPDAWAAESWEKAKSKGVLDGTRPHDPVTRQELASVLDRIGALS